MTTKSENTDLLSIPCVWKKTKQYLQNMGINYVEDLVWVKPEKLYKLDCVTQGYKLCKCQLYVYRMAVYFAETPSPDPEKLKWHKWKD